MSKYDRLKGEQPLPFDEGVTENGHQKEGATGSQTSDAVLARIRAARPPQPEGKAPTYGRRADPRFTQLNANIPTELKRKLKRFTDEHGVTISEVLEQLLEDYLAGK